MMKQFLAETPWGFGSHHKRICFAQFKDFSKLGFNSSIVVIRPEIRRMSQRQDDMWSFIAYDPQTAGYQTAFGVEMAIFVDYAMYKK